MKDKITTKPLKIIFAVLEGAVALVAIGTSIYLIVNFRSVDKQGAVSFAHYGPIYTYPYLYRSFDAGQIYGGGLDLRDIWGRKSVEDLTYVVLLEPEDISGTLRLKNKDENLDNFSREVQLKEGDQLYLDRAYKIRKIPKRFKGYQWLTTSNDYKNFSEGEFLSFELAKPSKVYVAYDSRSTAIPGWLQDSYKGTDENIEVQIGNLVIEMKIYERNYSAGPVSLGGNKFSPATGACFLVKIPNEQSKTGYVDTCCYYQADKKISDLCETAGARATLDDFFVQLKPRNWPLPILANENPSDYSESLSNLFSRLPKGGNFRMDISKYEFYKKC